MKKENYSRSISLSLLIILLTNIITFSPNTNAATLDLQSDTITATLKIRLDSINGITENIPADSILSIIINDTINTFYINGSVIDNDIINITSDNNFDINYTDTFTIIDYQELFNWNDIMNVKKAKELPDRLKMFIDGELAKAEDIFHEEPDFQLFKEQWKNANITSNANVRITTEQISNATLVIPNNIVIEFRQFANKDKIDFTIYHKQRTDKIYIHELLKRDENIYYGNIKNIKTITRASINAPLILEYNISIDTSRLDIGDYTLYAEIDTGLDLKFKSENITTAINIPEELLNSDYIVHLNNGTNIISYKDLTLELDALKPTLLGIRVITDPFIDLTSYNILSRIFEIKFHDEGSINTMKISIPHIVTEENGKLLIYNNGWFEASNVTRSNNTISGYFNGEGLFLVATEKVDESTDEVRREDNERRRSSVSSVKPVMDRTFPIILRVDEPSDTFNIDLTKYGIYLNSINVSLTEPTNVFYITLTIPDNIPFSLNNILTYFKLDSTMLRTIDRIEMNFELDDFTNLKLYKVDNNKLIEVRLDEGKAIDSLGEFVLTGSRNVISTNSIESTAIFPSINRNIDIAKEPIDDYNYLFDIHGYDLKIDFDGVINIVDIKKEENSLLLKVSKNNAEKMVITLPRNVIDAKQANGDDARFIILVDGKVASYQEKRFDDYRVLTIDMSDDASEIQIVGSRVVPEFNITMILLALSIMISIISIKRLKYIQ